MFCKLIKIPKKQTQNKCEKSKDKLARKRKRERGKTGTHANEKRRVPGNRGDDSVRELTAKRLPQLQPRNGMLVKRATW